MSRDTHLPQCPNKAEYRYAWGSKILHGCHQHANAMAALSNAIGVSFHAEPDIDGMMGNLQCEHRDDLDDNRDKSKEIVYEKN